MTTGVPLKYLVTINAGVLPETTDPLRTIRYVDIGTCGRGYLASDPEAMSFGTAPSRARRLVQAGDVIVSTVRTYLRAVWPVVGESQDLIVSTGFAVLSPRPELDPRFLGWLAQSDQVIEEIVARSVGVSYPGVNASDIGEIRVPVPPLLEQRAIADYLDAETRRIDEVSTCRAAMARLFEEWEQRQLVDLLGDWRVSRTHSLRQLGTALITGPFGTQLSASEYVDGGIPVINPTHISDGRIVPDPVVSVPRTVAERLDRHCLSPGDLVMGRKGDVGRAAVVGPTENGWLCGSDSIAVRTDKQKLLPEFLALTLSAAFYRQQLESRATGATINNVNESILMAFRVPAMPLHQQRRVVERGVAIRTRRVEGVRLFDRQVALLLERRQALVTVAITGQLGIAGVAA